MTRRLWIGAAAVVAGGAAYAVYRIGSRYDRDNALAGWTRFVETVKRGAVERERDLRDALGLDAGIAPDRGPGDGRAAAPATGPEVSAPPLSAAAARELLQDPAGPRPGA